MTKTRIYFFLTLLLAGSALAQPSGYVFLAGHDGREIFLAPNTVHPERVGGDLTIGMDVYIEAKLARADHWNIFCPRIGEIFSANSRSWHSYSPADPEFVAWVIICDPRGDGSGP